MNQNTGQNLVEVTILKDLDDDRYLTYQQFKDFINYLQPFSKHQAYFLFAGLTGFRPIECTRAQIENLHFEDRTQPKISNLITKYKRTIRTDQAGNKIITRIIKKKTRLIPLWFRDYLEEYIRQNWHTMADGYLFPSNRNNKKPMSVSGWESFLWRTRTQMINTNRIRYSWVNDEVMKRYGGPNKELRSIKRLSLYAFRKSRATWYAMACMEKGIQDVLLTTAHFMGHSQVNSTYRYIKRLVADRMDCGIEAIKPPNLEENFIGVDNPSNELDELAQKIANNEKFRDVLRAVLK
ncbi:hypothetical protein KY346_00735 [Candidatus Woesearchaeota archaeon]|nr:hypothetical protein [Candidatus Woesearchaeota archaeon]